MKQLVIVGAGGLGREVLAWARQSVEGWSVRGFIDDNGQALDGYAKDVPILGGTGVLAVHVRSRERWRRVVPEVSTEALLVWLEQPAAVQLHLREVEVFTAGMEQRCVV